MTNWLGRLCQEHITLEDTVLDLGCGIMQGTDDLKAKSILGVDIWAIYLDKIKSIFPTVMISMDETYRFMNDSYDVVICLDVIEHLDEDLALKIIDECKRICRKTAIIYTPKIFKDNKESVKDSWGLGNNPHQEHKCVIHANDFKSRGYTVHSVDGDSHLAIFEK